MLLNYSPEFYKTLVYSPTYILVNSHLYRLFPLVIPSRLGYSPQLFSRILGITLPFLPGIPIYSSELIYHAMLLLFINARKLSQITL